ncbi:uncharacterized protein CEXT_274461, partial [Caerostris extrusa]
MADMLNSSLNPLACSFIPSVKNEPLSKKHYKKLAMKLFQDYMDEKKAHGEKIFTKQEIINILEKIFSMKWDGAGSKKMLRFMARLSKIPPKVKLQEGEINNESVVNFLKMKRSTFDLSVVKLPKPSILLVSLYGLYRQETAVRPLLSLTQRPENLTDNVWSLSSKDLKLWNSCCEELCECPAMFGYCIPPSFFGNPFKLDHKCSKKGIHMGRYAEAPKGNEYILFDTRFHDQISVEPFDDYCENKVTQKDSLEFYSEQLKTIVGDVCNLISVKDNFGDSKPALGDCYQLSENFTETLWDEDPSLFARIEEVLEDDDNHPLLQDSNDEGISPETQEILRRCLTNQENEASDAENNYGTCDPPCSTWCRTSPKLERSDSVLSSSSAISLLNETTEFILNASKGSVSSDGYSNLKSDWALNHKRHFKRSFSANDCDLSYDEKYRANYRIPRFSTSCKEDLKFLRRDPINFFRSLENRNELWKDNDSGIISHWSSQEDFDENNDAKDGCFEDNAPMWSLFNSEDSLWKPLPECSQLDQHAKFMPKR